MKKGEDVEDIIDRAETTLRIKIPFLASLLREARIYKKELDEGNVASVDKEGHIYIDPEDFAPMKFKDQVYILGHEVLHAANMHGARCENKEHERWNLAADTKVNQMLSTMLETASGAVTPEHISKLANKDVEEVKADSDIELYDDIPPFDKDDDGNGNGNGKGRGKSQGEGQGKSQGNKRPDDNKTGEDLSDEEKEGGDKVKDGGDFNDEENEVKKEEWEKNISKAAMKQKMAGTMPSGLERYVDDILSPDLDVKSLIKQQVQNGLSSIRINNWRRPSRKHKDLPGHKMLSTPTFWCLVDTSGSINDEELKMFLGVAHEFASRTDINVMSWDAEAYDVVEADNKRQVISKVAKEMEGGGGTKVQPCLNKVVDDMESNDIVGIMTDGHVFDWDEGKTSKLLKRVSTQASSAFVYTTDEKIESKGWVTVQS